MAYVRRKKTFILEFSNEDGEFEGLEATVTSLPTGEFLELSALVNKDPMTDDDVKEVLTTFAGVLVGWNVQEEDETPVPATFEGLLSLDLEFVMHLIAAWMKVVSPPAEGSDLGKDSSSGEKFPGQPLTMEAL